MFGIINFSSFIFAGICLNLYPGPDTMYVIARSISQGKKAGIISVLGISTGGLVHTIFTGIGLSQILATSAIAFSVIKYLGAGYLIYLGITTIISKKHVESADLKKTASIWTIYRQGFITNLLNPKVALFFLSFLPQFIGPGSTFGIIPFFILGCTFITTGTIWCMAVAIFASQFTQLFKQNKTFQVLQKKIAGIVYLFLGIRLLHNK